MRSHVVTQTECTARNTRRWWLTGDSEVIDVEFMMVTQTESMRGLSIKSAQRRAYVFARRIVLISLRVASLLQACATAPHAAACGAVASRLIIERLCYLLQHNVQTQLELYFVCVTHCLYFPGPVHVPVLEHNTGFGGGLRTLAAQSQARNANNIR